MQETTSMVYQVNASGTVGSARNRNMFSIQASHIAGNLILTTPAGLSVPVVQSNLSVQDFQTISDGFLELGRQYARISGETTPNSAR